MMPTRSRSQAGFSLVELMVAMVVTLVVSGAIFGLMSSGQTAFRRTPEITEMQQAVRVAMDVMQRDIATAGVGMGAFFQAFGDNLNGVGPAGPDAVNTDHLEIFGNTGECPDVQTKAGPCPGPDCAYSGGNLNMAVSIPTCYSNDSFVLVGYGDAGAKMGLAHRIHGGTGEKVNFPPGLCNDANFCDINSVANLQCYEPNNTNPPTKIQDCPPEKRPNRMTTVQILRYEIALDDEGIPSLWRSPLGGRSTNDAAYVPAGPGNPDIWQLLARGIEDLQVQYRATGPAGGPLPGWADTPGAVAEPNYATLTRDVRVSLVARTVNERGAATATGPAALRARLTSVSSPRAALNYMGLADPPQWQ
ncbi:MAG: prepilin-type N-terminal cleavage/methylation domain-containing protein [Acidobacteria bacterium]|nr:prepilin-type N-terminal cleavage/methylation domain-containing protein [Acidobacteriota bacterium]